MGETGLWGRQACGGDRPVGETGSWGRQARGGDRPMSGGVTGILLLLVNFSRLISKMIYQNDVLLHNLIMSINSVCQCITFLKCLNIHKYTSLKENCRSLDHLKPSGGTGLSCGRTRRPEHTGLY